MKRQHKQKKSFFRKPLFIWAAGLVVAGAAIIAGLEMTNRTHFFHDAPRPVTASSDTKGEPQDGTTTTPIASDGSSPDKDASATDSGTAPGDNKAPGNGSGTVNLLDPTGDFVSNHKPSLSKSSSMSSTCSTTPGATCVITFTKGSDVKAVEVRTTDRGGSAYWDWKLQDIGLTAGTWRVTATASLSGQTKTAADATNLEVSP